MTGVTFGNGFTTTTNSDFKASHLSQVSQHYRHHDEDTVTHFKVKASHLSQYPYRPPRLRAEVE